MMLLALIGRPIRKVACRVMLALVPPPELARPNAPPEYPRFPLF